MQKPDISQKAFWDVRFSEIDFEKNALYVMEKVFNYGTWKDQVAIMKFYGLQRISKEIIYASPLLVFYVLSCNCSKKILNVTTKCNSTRYPGIIKEDLCNTRINALWL